LDGEANEGRQPTRRRTSNVERRREDEVSEVSEVSEVAEVTEVRLFVDEDYDDSSTSFHLIHLNFLRLLQFVTCVVTGWLADFTLIDARRDFVTGWQTHFVTSWLTS